MNQTQHWISPLWQSILKSQWFFWNYSLWNCSQIPIWTVAQTPACLSVSIHVWVLLSFQQPTFQKLTNKYVSFQLHGLNRFQVLFVSMTILKRRLLKRLLDHPTIYTLAKPWVGRGFRLRYPHHQPDESGHRPRLPSCIGTDRQSLSLSHYIMPYISCCLCSITHTH